MFKSQLQEYAQKCGLLPPVYGFTREGSSHEPRYKAFVTINDVKYESPPGFSKLKPAQHAAAKAALEALSKSSVTDGVLPNPVEGSGLCKNLLQEYAQKLSLPSPVYRTLRTGQMHAPTFNSTVEVAGRISKGGAAKSKKEAEIDAARAALLAIYAESQSAQEPHKTAGTVGGSSLDAQLEHLGGKKRGRSSDSSDSEILEKKAAIVKEEKADATDAPLSCVSTAMDSVRALDSVPLSDIKPTFLSSAPSSIEIPGLELGSSLTHEHESKDQVVTS